MTKPSRKNLELAKKACFGKIGHGSMLAAQFILDKMGGKDGALLGIYKCQFCDKYHIGHDWKKSDVPIKKPQYDSKNIIPRKPNKKSRKNMKKDFDEMFFLNNFSE